MQLFFDHNKGALVTINPMTINKEMFEDIGSKFDVFLTQIKEFIAAETQLLLDNYGAHLSEVRQHDPMLDALLDLNAILHSKEKFYAKEALAENPANLEPNTGPERFSMLTHALQQTCLIPKEKAQEFLLMLNASRQYYYNSDVESIAQLQISGTYTTLDQFITTFQSLCNEISSAYIAANHVGDRASSTLQTQLAEIKAILSHTPSSPSPHAQLSLALSKLSLLESTIAKPQEPAQTEQQWTFFTEVKEPEQATTSTTPIAFDF